MGHGDHCSILNTHSDNDKRLLAFAIWNKILFHNALINIFLLDCNLDVVEKLASSRSSRMRLKNVTYGSVDE